MNNSANIGSFLFSVLVLGTVATVVFLHLFNKSQVKKYSTRIKLLNAINKRYTFHADIRSLSYTVSTKTKRQFDKFDFIGYLQTTIRENKDTYTTLIKKCEENASKHQEYTAKIQEIPRQSIKQDAKKCKLSVERYEKYEEQLIQSATKNAIKTFTVTCRLFYSSPKGRSNYSKSQTYSFEDIMMAYKNADREIVTKESIAYERAMVTDSLRYDIFKRDGFKCKICGRSQQDGATLHLDHIIPVSKGGKSVPSNLRTLCDRCNLGKSDKYDPNGLN